MIRTQSFIVSGKRGGPVELLNHTCRGDCKNHFMLPPRPPASTLLASVPSKHPSHRCDGSASTCFSKHHCMRASLCVYRIASRFTCMAKKLTRGDAHTTPRYILQNYRSVYMRTECLAAFQETRLMPPVFCNTAGSVIRQKQNQRSFSEGSANGVKTN